MGYLSCQAPSHEDISALVALDQSALGGLWSAEAYSREIDSPNSCLLMLVWQPNVPYAIGAEAGDLSIASITDLQTGRGRSLASANLGEFASAIRSDEIAVDGAGEARKPEVEATTLLGLGCYWAILDEAHITLLAIDPRYQRRGLGQWLLANLLVDASDRALTRATLEVRPSNSRALALYETFGFETLGRRRRYYADGEDALILWQNSLKTPEFRDRLNQQHGAARHRLERQGWQITDEKIVVNRT